MINCAWRTDRSLNDWKERIFNLWNRQYISCCACCWFWPCCAVWFRLCWRMKDPAPRAKASIHIQWDMWATIMVHTPIGAQLAMMWLVRQPPAQRAFRTHGLKTQSYIYLHRMWICWVWWVYACLAAHNNRTSQAGMPRLWTRICCRDRMYRFEHRRQVRRLRCGYARRRDTDCAPWS